MKRLRANVRYRPDLAIIDLHGDVDGASEDTLEEAYTRAESHDPSRVLLNFSDVAYINSKGIALIVVLLGRVRQTDRRLLACGLSDHYREILQITRLSDFITIYDDEQSALADREKPSNTVNWARHKQPVETI
jgi:anti-anti-sigma factor